MSDRSALETLFLDNLGWMNRTLATLARRLRLTGDDADDFCSWVRLRLMADDYALLGKWRGDSSLRTYLQVVLTRLAGEYRDWLWGRWRPSTAARSLGTLAVRLETLVYRDRLTLAHAAGQLRLAGHTDLPDRALAVLLSQLPVNTGRPHPASLWELGGVASPLPTPSQEMEHAEDDGLRRIASEALASALSRLPDEDQEIVRLRYWKGLSLADVARALGLAQKPLYRRVEKILLVLRQHLRDSGLSGEALPVLGLRDALLAISWCFTG